MSQNTPSSEAMHEHRTRCAKAFTLTGLKRFRKLHFHTHPLMKNCVIARACGENLATVNHDAGGVHINAAPGSWMACPHIHTHICGGTHKRPKRHATEFVNSRQ